MSAIDPTTKILNERSAELFGEMTPTMAARCGHDLSEFACTPVATEMVEVFAAATLLGVGVDVAAGEMAQAATAFIV